MGTKAHRSRLGQLPLTLVLAVLHSVGCDGDAPASESSDTEDTDATGGATTGEDAAGSDAATASSTTAPGSETSGGSTGNASDTTTPPGTTGSDDPSEPTTCSLRGLAPGSYADVEVVVDGETRQYDLYIPASIDTAEPTPLVVNFHGYLNTPALQAGLSQFNDAAEGAGVIVAYPRGRGQSWNGGQCCGDADASNVDDVAFARTLVNHVGLSSCIDTDRVFAIGMSNGGHLSHRLACEAADVFAGAASATGVLGLDPADCAPSRPISVLQFHGTADAIVPYNGIGPGYPHVRDMMQAWAERNGCAPVPNVSFEMGDATCETWPACDNAVEVSLCTIEGAGHCWPGNPSCPYGTPTTDASANARILAMMSAQSL